MSNSSSWYTPPYIWSKIHNTFDSKFVYDPFPPNGLSNLKVEFDDGYERDWAEINHELGYDGIYCNPPIPASKAALKAIETYENDKSVNIIFAGYSESVCWQVPELETYVHVKCRKRINWIDGRKEVNGVSNPNYLQPGRNPAHYSSFFLLSSDTAIIQRFIDNFSDMGSIKWSRLCKSNDGKVLMTNPDVILKVN
jgi:hypothetical protein